MSGRVIPPHLADRPFVGGLIVPWVTIWTNEVRMGGTVSRTPIGLVGKLTEQRFGMTCMVTPNDPSGRPLWRSTHAHRQRRCMANNRCQVCGRKIEGVPFWIIPPGDNGDTGRMWHEDGLTKQPPVCGDCYEAAMVWCPHLASVDGVEVYRGERLLVGMTGDYIDELHQVHEYVYVPLGDPDARWVLGRELVVSLDIAERLR